MTIQNSKFEYRNPKQVRMAKTSVSETEVRRLSLPKFRIRFGFQILCFGFSPDGLAHQTL